MSILIITTGGTIGAEQYPDPKNPPEFCTVPALNVDLVRNALCAPEFAKFKTRCVSLVPVDSKDIDDVYRQQILKIIRGSKEELILITHGTDTLLKSADFFYEQLQNEAALIGKKIILTGSMTPLANGPISDGHKNLHYALSILTRATASLPTVSTILSNDNKTKGWTPHLYPHKPNRWKKHYDPDGQRSKIIPFATAHL
jgi:L-asparaginase/Glu-tRNA(Gln) amidotransferase subunit D